MSAARLPPRHATSLAPIAPIGVAALMLVAMGGTEVTAILSGLAACAAIVAAVERRHVATITAAALAMGLGPIGLLVAPIALGIAVATRRAALGPHAAAGAITTWRVLGDWTAGEAVPTLFSLVGYRPQLFALVSAIAIAFSAWLSASVSDRHASEPAMLRLAAIAVIGGAVIVPMPVTALMLPILLVTSWRPAVTLPPRAANDDRLVRSTIRLAA